MNKENENALIIERDRHFMTPRNQFKQYVLDFLSISDNDWESTAGTVSSDVQKIEEELQE